MNEEAPRSALDAPTVQRLAALSGVHVTLTDPRNAALALEVILRADARVIELGLGTLQPFKGLEGGES
ncbi:hypothetical protein [Deinococcus yavapaiensis]|uniref:Uncharacterized protein n=1 Tax=Deinococcus yavapaiensis KR-236 TaxID=694435 RepID=A0A318SB21_9DEIO|nr:hypothetical protein [Deinococcus yavapaiensis]PYE53819.1 hypothetical protein DES52_10777 [Deinococcus yavapaiensis KR-236]